MIKDRESDHINPKDVKSTDDVRAMFLWRVSLRLPSLLVKTNKEINNIKREGAQNGHCIPQDTPQDTIDRGVKVNLDPYSRGKRVSSF